LTVVGNVGIGASLNINGTNAVVNTAGLRVSGFSDLIGNVGIGSSAYISGLTFSQGGLRVNGYSDLTGNVGIGASLTTISAAVLDSLSVTKSISSATLGVSGNVGLGASLTVSSTGAFRLSGQTNCTNLTNGGKLTTDSSGNVFCAADIGGSGSQTPWTSDIDADNFSLLDLGTNITARAGLAIATAGTGDLALTITDNNADALDIQEGTNDYININTTNSSENITFGNSTTNPRFIFTGGNVGISNTAPGTTLLVGGNVNIGYTGYISDSLGLAVRGNVGVGTTSPNFPLHVIGNVGIGTSLTVTSLINTSGLNVTATSSLGTAYAAGLTVSGNTGVGGSLTTTGLDYATGGLRVNGFSDLTGNVGIGASLATTGLEFAQGGLRVNGFSDLTGNVGIGTSLTTQSAAILSSLSVINGATLGTAYASGLTVVGNVGIGASLNINGTNAVVNTAGLRVSGFSDLIGNVGIGSSAY
ncbi:hypothetical protein HY008_01575, partial [Candidatus Woesebacteria bacterium]|nr:hypothetical protein [Candidatus Woesebacteria bacterium]